ncbi:MAG: YvcK family protein [Clostridia bacterium]|nr:YvcK family protein [Clostridia bacterium]
MGGGTGLATLLRGLKAYTHHITAIVTVTDDGGSSGRLRGELGIPPPGDIRNCLVALAEAEPLMEQLFQYRFSRGSLAGHNLGNLLIGALTDVLGDFEAALRAASAVLAVRGQVLPSTLSNVQICARFRDGRVVCGETRLVATGAPIDSVFLQPPDVHAPPAAVEALEAADLIVLGPGSLYTSVLPNLLVRDLARALRASRGLKVYVVNVMTQPGETDGYTAADHVSAVLRHAGEGSVDCVLVNTGPVDPVRLRRYRSQRAEPVVLDAERLAALGVRVVTGDLISRDEWARHDPDRLAALLLRLLDGRWLSSAPAEE